MNQVGKQRHINPVGAKLHVHLNTHSKYGQLDVRFDSIERK